MLFLCTIGVRGKLFFSILISLVRYGNFKRITPERLIAPSILSPNIENLFAARASILDIFIIPSTEYINLRQINSIEISTQINFSEFVKIFSNH